jgi:hypothetical protein
MVFMDKFKKMLWCEKNCKRVKKNILSSILLIMIALNCIGCESYKKSSQAITKGAAVEAVKESGFCNVSIDPKVELLSVVQYIADDPNIIKEKSNLDNNQIKYSEDISKYFSKYKDEPVVSLYKQMMSNGFSYDCPPNVMLYVDNNLKLLDNVPNDIIDRSSGKETLVKFLDLLDDFRNKSKFDEFYMSHIEYYKDSVLNIKRRVDKSGCIEKIIKYYGYEQNSFNIIVQILSSGGYGIRVPGKDGKFDVYDFMVVPNDDIDFAQLITHEFGHSYINPLTEENINEVNKYNNLFTPIKEKMSKQAYPEWEYCVNEHIVRAVTYRIIEDLYGSNASMKYINHDIGRDFIYIKSLSERLKEYENNRDKYPTFKEFYPRLIDDFKELSNK